MYTFTPKGKLQTIRDAPEYVAKTPTPVLPALSLASPLINLASPIINLVTNISPTQRPPGSMAPSEALAAAPRMTRSGTVVMRNLQQPEGSGGNGVMDGDQGEPRRGEGTNGVVMETNAKLLVGFWQKDL